MTIFEKNGLRKKIGDPKLNFRNNFQMLLHGFAWRSSKNKVLKPKTSKIKTYQTNLKKYFKYICFIGAFKVPCTLP